MNPQKFVGLRNLEQIMKLFKDALRSKVDVAEGMGLSQNSYTDEDKAVVNSIDEKIDTAVKQAVTEALAEVEGASSTQVVQTLPSSGVAGTIYLTSNAGSTPDNQYDEYVWTGTEFEKLGGEESEALSDAEVDSLWNNAGTLTS